eukprot:TRINITY_DN918_c0_g1_i1.p1 TRINITY_DN918_c0_g1~~TRINITY_DN918_c0_g1_i1.p1  ORF type:complete len:213 (+),score=29.95 TRINITY_DN918_c0_g1_i1:109-747(+)
MTILSFNYIPPEPAAVEITQSPSNAVRAPPRKVDILPLLVYILHVGIIPIGIIPIILFGWIGFFFVEISGYISEFIFFVLVLAPIFCQILFILPRLRAIWFFKYGVHGFIQNRENGEEGYEVIDATTHAKMADVGIWIYRERLEEADNGIVLYNPNKVRDMLPLVQYRNTFYVHHGELCVKKSTRSILAAFTAAWLLCELIILISIRFITKF